MVKSTYLGVMIKQLKELWYYCCKYVLIWIPDKWFYQLVAYVNYTRLGFKFYFFDLNLPKTFNEKLNFLKLKYRNPLAPIVADKVLVRRYVEEKIGEKYLVPVIGIYDNPDEIAFDQLPNRFALKTNHGSGWNLICKDKNTIDWKVEVKKIKVWLKKNAYYLNREWQYQVIQPKLICEVLLDYEIKDYKFFCRNGQPVYVQVDSERFSNHERTIFTTNWQETDIRITYPKIKKKMEPPATLDEMLGLSAKLAEPFLFCRVDLYEHQGRVYFGEITLHPGAGSEPFGNKDQDLRMGYLIELSAITIE